jgi:hypothetical protein
VYRGDTVSQHDATIDEHQPLEEAQDSPAAFRAVCETKKNGHRIRQPAAHLLL